MEAPADEASPSETVRGYVWRSSLGIRERLHALGVGSYWLIALIALVAMFVPAVETAHFAVMCLGALGSVGLMLLGAILSYEVRDECTATLDARGLRLKGKRSTVELSREQLAYGLLRWDRGGCQLRLRVRAGARYDLDLPDRETGERWLRALSLDAGHRAVRVVTNRRVLQWVFAYFFGAFFATPLAALGLALLALSGRSHHEDVGVTLTYLFTVPGYYFAARFVGRADVTIGVDGVRVNKLLHGRFVPYATLSDVEVSPGNPNVLQLRKTNGRVERVRFATSADAISVCERVRAAFAAWGEAPRADLLSAYGDAPATAEVWRDRFLDALRPGGYRAVMVTLSDVESVVSAGAATPEQRVGAVLALRELSSQAGSTGVRVNVDVAADRAAQKALDEAMRETRPKTQTR